MILGIIPARGGSKGIPRKNLMPVAGKPLLWWSIQAAKASRLLDRFIVSTEDEQIGGYAKQCNAEVLWRPKELAEDNSATIAVMQHVLKEINADVVVLLQPTSPIRINLLIDRAIEKFQSSGADTVATGLMCRFWEWGIREVAPRQVDPGYFYDDGNVYVMKSDHVRQGLSVGKKRVPLIVETYYHPEIDDETEAWIVEDLMLRLQAKYGADVLNMAALQSDNS